MTATETKAVFKAACIQMRSGLDRARNVADAREMISKAAALGAQFVATPEMTNIVDRDAKRLLADLPPEDGLSEIEVFRALAVTHNIHLLIGSMALLSEDGDRAHNRGFLFSPQGDIISRYDKIHMFDVQLPHGETWRESSVYVPGEAAGVVPTPLANFGLTICYDVRFPLLYRKLAQQGANVLCVPAAFTRQTGFAHWEILLRARAIECGAFVIAPAQGGDHEDGRETWGHSLIINPWGEIIGQSDNDEPGIILADIDPSQSKIARQRIPSLDLDIVNTVNI